MAEIIDEMQCTAVVSDFFFHEKGAAAVGCACINCKLLLLPRERCTSGGSIIKRAKQKMSEDVALKRREVKRVVVFVFSHSWRYPAAAHKFITIVQAKGGGDFG
jgi:hypothetical protein